MRVCCGSAQRARLAPPSRWHKCWLGWMAPVWCPGPRAGGPLVDAPHPWFRELRGILRPWSPPTRGVGRVKAHITRLRRAPRSLPPACCWLGPAAAPPLTPQLILPWSCPLQALIDATLTEKYGTLIPDGELLWHTAAGSSLTRVLVPACRRSRCSTSDTCGPDHKLSTPSHQSPLCLPRLCSQRGMDAAVWLPGEPLCICTSMQHADASAI